MRTPTFAYERLVTGVFSVFLKEPRMRLGVVSGRAGNWLAETPNGWGISRYRTRQDAAMALLNQARIEKRVSDRMQNRAKNHSEEGCR